jgi:hypothetical protein
MGIVWNQPIDHPRAWRGAELGQDGPWLILLTAADRAELHRALQHAQRSNVPMLHLTQRDFPLEAMAAKLAALADTIRHGSGFSVMRGLDISDYDDAEVGLLFWGMGLYLGAPLGQNPQGDLLGHVFDQGRSYGNIDVRGYETNAHLPFHSDSCDLLGLMCLRRGVSGGLSSLVSSTTVHNEILAEHPEYLGLLYNGFQYIRRELALTGAGVSEHRIPVFGHRDGVVSSRYLRNQINAGAVKLGVPLTAMETEALDFLDATTQRADLRLDFMLEPGDMEFANNYTTLHSRTEFVNGASPQQQRHMLRLWLRFAGEAWPTKAPFLAHKGFVLAERERALLEA